MPSSTENPIKKNKSVRTKLRKWCNKYRKLKKTIKQLREWPEEADKAWKPKTESCIVGTQTKQFSTKYLGTQIEPCPIENTSTQTKHPCVHSIEIQTDFVMEMLDVFFQMDFKETI